jgi:uncharacterized protein
LFARPGALDPEPMVLYGVKPQWVITILCGFANGVKSVELVPTMAFWDEKPLEAMTTEEWEALCDGCGKCCLLKLEDEESGQIFPANVRCKLLDGDTCGCSDYPNRQAKVPDCIKLTPEKVREIAWIPKSCAYRRIAEGRGLAWWHPLVSGDPETVHAAGISVRGRTIAEENADTSDWESHIIDWVDWEPAE